MAQSSETPRLSSEQRLALREDAKGFSYRQLAEKYGISRWQVYHVLHGRKPMPRKIKLNEEQLEDIRTSTLSQATLARKYGVQQSTISRYRNGRAEPRTMEPGEQYIDDNGVVQTYRPAAGSKLTEEEVRTIRARYAERGITQHALALEYGVTILTISNVIRGKTWRNVK